MKTQTWFALTCVTLLCIKRISGGLQEKDLEGEITLKGRILSTAAFCITVQYVSAKCRLLKFTLKWSWSGASG